MSLTTLNCLLCDQLACPWPRPEIHSITGSSTIYTFTTAHNRPSRSEKVAAAICFSSKTSEKSPPVLCSLAMGHGGLGTQHAKPTFPSREQRCLLALRAGATVLSAGSGKLNSGPV